MKEQIVFHVTESRKKLNSSSPRFCFGKNSSSVFFLLHMFENEWLNKKMYEYHSVGHYEKTAL